MRYFLQVLIALDQLVNALLGGWADETLSSHAHRGHRNGKWYGFMRHIINLMFFWQVDHCKDAFHSERIGRQLPPELRQ